MADEGCRKCGEEGHFARECHVQQEVVEEVEITSAGTADRRVTWQLTVQSLKFAVDAVRRVM